MHIYNVGDVSLPSVTTILQCLGNKEINIWANRLGFRHINYETELNRLADNGTLMHTVIQHIVDSSLKDEPITYKDKMEERRYFELAQKFNNMISDYNYETIFTERSFASVKLGYGGTIDWLANMNGLIMLNDFKSSKRVYIKHLLQIGGYYNLLVDDGIYNPDGGSIILVNDKVSTLYPIGKETIEELGRTFNALYEVYKIVNGPIIPFNEETLQKIKNKG